MYNSVVEPKRIQTFRDVPVGMAQPHCAEKSSRLGYCLWGFCRAETPKPVSFIGLFGVASFTRASRSQIPVPHPISASSRGPD